MPRPAAAPPTARPEGPCRTSRRLSFLVWAYAAAVLGVAVLVQRLSDEWWPATVVLFAPRWLWALPLLVLVPAAALRRPRLLWLLAATAGMLLVPVAGFVVPSAAALKAPAVQPDLRLLTYNIGGGELDPSRIAPWLDALAPDVAMFQECEDAIGPAKPALLARGWHVELQHGSCMASRHPIRKVEVRDPEAIWKMGGSGVIVRYEVQTPRRMVSIVNLHLETVREGLNAVIRGGLGGASEMESNIDLRHIESALARAFANQTSGPLIVAGDFNMPQESAIYRTHWREFTNAFACGGWGLGATKATRWHGIRIDHVLLGPGWSCAAAEVAPHLGLDHRPVVVDLGWQGLP